MAGVDLGESGKGNVEKFKEKDKKVFYDYDFMGFFETIKNCSKFWKILIWAESTKINEDW